MQEVGGVWSGCGWVGVSVSVCVILDDVPSRRYCRSCRRVLPGTGDFAFLGQVDAVFKQVSPSSLHLRIIGSPARASYGCSLSLWWRQSMFSALLAVRMRSRAICRLLGVEERPLLRVRPWSHR